LPLFKGAENENIHLPSIEVLSKTGVVVYDKDILELLDTAGYKVDKRKHLVKMPEKLVKDAVDSAPNMITLCGIDGLVRGRTGIQEKAGIFRRRPGMR